jgi:hypothetical protein
LHAAVAGLIIADVAHGRDRLAARILPMKS